MRPLPPEFADTRDLTRRAWLGAALLLSLVRGAGAVSATLPAATSLRDELALALKGGNPLMVLVSLDGCPFCRRARQQYLSPMREQQGLPIVQVDLHSDLVLQDFNGAAITHDKLVRRWNVPVAPTVLFFGRGGAEVAPRLVGGESSDYYGAYLDQRLEQARSAIKR